MMNNLLESQLYIVIITIAYYILLKKHTFFQFNRWFLIGGVALTTLLSFLPFYVSLDNNLSNAILLNEITATTTNLIQTNIGSEEGFSVSTILLTTSLIISALILTKSIIETYNVLKLPVKKTNNYSYSISKKAESPFALFNRLVVNKWPIDTAILKHEQAHINQKHYIDLIFVHTLCALFWFNPFVWLWLKAIKQNHEYLADKAVVEDNSTTIQAYKSLILSNVFNTSVPVLCHSFINTSTLKQRFMMMTRKKTKRSSLLKLAFVLPFALYVFAACNNEPEEAAPVVSQAEVMPEFKGGNEALFSYLGENIVYPEAAKVDSLEGVVYVSFIVDKQGKIKDTKVLKGVDPRLDETAVKVIADMPDWTPGKDKGKSVAVQYNLPIRFVLQ